MTTSRSRKEMPLFFILLFVQIPKRQSGGFCQQNPVTAFLWLSCPPMVQSSVVTGGQSYITEKKDTEAPAYGRREQLCKGKGTARSYGNSSFLSNLHTVFRVVVPWRFIFMRYKNFTIIIAEKNIVMNKSSSISLPDIFPP